MKTKAKAAKPDAPKAFGDMTEADLREPTEAERVAMQTAAERAATRPARLSVRTVPSDGNRAIRSEHKDQAGWVVQMNDTFGTTSREFASHTLSWIMMVMERDGEISDLSYNTALAVMGAIAPRDELEASLAGQMIATNDLAMDTMVRASRAQSLEARQAIIGMATKLTRTFTAQMEALARLRGGGKQEVKVTHEHRHTYVGPGGQAIIGDVHTGGGGESRIEGQPHGAVASLAFAPGSPMWSEDTTRDAVPIPSHAREAEMQGSRRPRRRSIG